jgi:hypothetical protein
MHILLCIFIFSIIRGADNDLYFGIPYSIVSFWYIDFYTILSFLK